MIFTSRERCLLLTLLATSYLGVVSGGPIQNERGLVARQATTSAVATTAQTTSQATTVSQTATQSSATSVAASTATTSTTASVTTTAQSSTTTHTTSTHTTSPTSTITSNTSSSSSSTTTPSSTTSSASATATASSNIFSKSSPYFGYAVGVVVVVCIFGALLLVLVIRFIVQKFSKKPNAPPITANAGAWRYSQDTELYSPGAVPDSANTTVSASTAPLARHKGLGAEMGEAQAFLSTESVALYPPAKYTDEDADPRRHSRSLSTASSSQATTTPYVQRRPLSFLHSPPATHPAFIVDRDQESSSGHGHSDAVELKAVSERPQEAQSNDATPGPSMANMLLARAGHSDAYRQPTLGSTTMLSRAASTASAYSQPSGIYTPPLMPELPPPPMPVAPQAQVQPRPQARDLSPDVAAALSTMQTDPSTDTIPGDGLIHPEDHHATLRQTPGRMGWGRQAPSSIHSHSDLFFGHEQR